MTLTPNDLNDAQKARFWSRIKIGAPDECWNWTSETIKGPYGRFRTASGRVISHRMSYLLSGGEIPDGMCVCHTCDNRLCCNPWHLWVGTKSDNSRDMVNKGRSYRPIGDLSPRKRFPGSYLKNEALVHSRLTAEDVRMIRWGMSKGLNQRELAFLFKCDRRHIGSIVRRKTWAHLN